MVLQRLGNLISLLFFYIKAIDKQNKQLLIEDKCPNCGQSFTSYRTCCGSHANKVAQWGKKKRNRKIKRLENKGKNRLRYCLECGEKVKLIPRHHHFHCGCGFNKTI
jgi:uncharacterized C2H2 Zn-finger protein